MRRRMMILGSLAAISVASEATASQFPKPGPLDPRIRTVFYNSDQVVMLKGYFGYQMMIEFGDERIENVSIGNGLAWQVTPNKKANLLFIKIVLAPPT
jgi:type IV secretion system protein VirB9